MPNQMSLDGGRKSKYLELNERNHTEAVRRGAGESNQQPLLLRLRRCDEDEVFLIGLYLFNQANFGILYVEVLTVSQTPLHYLQLHNNSSWRTCSDSVSPRQSSSEVLAHRWRKKNPSSAVDFSAIKQTFRLIPGRRRSQLCVKAAVSA